MAFGKFVDQILQGWNLNQRALCITCRILFWEVGEDPGPRGPPRRSCVEAELPGRGLEMLVAVSMESLRGGGAGSEFIRNIILPDVLGRG